MKKGILMLLAVVLLASCGDTVKKVPYEEKKAMVEKALTDPAVKKELDDIIVDLKKKADKGNKEAVDEHEEYMKAIHMRAVIDKPHPVSM